MRYVCALLATTLLVSSLAGCQREDAETQKKLDYLIGKVDDLDKKVAAGGGRGAAAAGQPMPQQPRRGPDPAAIYAIDISGAPVEGPANAKVTIVEGFEFACPFCQRVAPTIEQLRKDYPNDVRVVKMQYIVHPDRATLPAQAACAAQKQDKYAEFEKKIWTDGFGKGNLDEPMMLGFAKDLGLNESKFKADMNGDACKTQVQEHMKRLAAVGVNGTPAFYINGRFLSGARPIEQFKALIDEELKKANDAIGAGKVTAEAYYQKVVMEGGKKAL